MGRFASGKKSYGTSDITGFRVRYPKLRTTWNNLRVEPEEFDIKHPQLTPAKNIFDATALRDPRPDNDAEPVTIFLNYNWLNTNTTSMQATEYNKPNLPVAKGSVGFVTFEIINTSLSGIEASSAFGTLVLSSEIGASGTAGTGAVGTETVELAITEAGVAGTGAVGNETVDIPAWGFGTWGSGTWGN